MGCCLAPEQCPRQGGKSSIRVVRIPPAEVTKNGPSLWMSFHTTLLGRGFNSRHLHQFKIQQHPTTSNKLNQVNEFR